MDKLPPQSSPRQTGQVFKVCTKCLRNLPIDSFHRGRRRGKPARTPRCRECHNAAERERYQSRHKHSARLHARRLREIGKKRCSLCTLVLPLDMFYSRNDGRGTVSRCRRCSSSEQRKKRPANKILSSAERMELRAMGLKYCPCCRHGRPLTIFGVSKRRPDGLSAYCKPCVRENDRKRRLSDLERERERGREMYRKHQWRSTTSNEASAAHQAVSRAVKSGRLVRPAACSACGSSGSKIEAHHDDYSQQLAVVWLCASCHHLAHALHEEYEALLSFGQKRTPSELLFERLRKAG